LSVTNRCPLQSSTHIFEAQSLASEHVSRQAKCARYLGNHKTDKNGPKGGDSIICIYGNQVDYA
jgi:hypothetical protein